MFPFYVVFDLEQFQSDVNQALSEPREVREQSILKKAGLRLVIQLKHVADFGKLSAATRDLHPAFQVARLFDPGNAEGLEGRDDGVMRSFALATLIGVSFRDIRQSPFDLAYFLADKIDAVNVEPSLPYIRFWDHFEENQPNVDLTSNDKAWALRQIRAPEAWATMNKSGLAPTIGHLDTGWSDHVDLDQAAIDHQRAVDLVTEGGDAEDPLIHKLFRNAGHGTKTGSVIVSRGGVIDSGEGTTGPGQITGVAPTATLLPIRCIESVVVMFSDQVARGIYSATKLGCGVLSMSIGGRPMTCLKTAMQFAGQANTIPVCAAGNIFPWVVWPANYPEAIAVGATNCFEEPWPQTASGSRVDISAPGENVWVAKPSLSNRYEVEQGSGTSYATAHVAGVAALWLQHFGKSVLLTHAQASGLSLSDYFRSEIKRTCKKTRWSDTAYGAGIVDAEALIAFAPKTAFNTVSLNQPDSNSFLVASLSSGWRWGHTQWTRIERVMQNQNYRSAFENEIMNAMVDRWGSLEPNGTKNTTFDPDSMESLENHPPERVRLSQTLRRTALWSS